MNDAANTPGGPGLTSGVAIEDLPDGAMLPGKVHGEPVLLARRGDELFAIGAFCTHYGAPLADGLLVDNTIRCPWHHACFNLRTGEALRAPALDPVSCWQVERKDGRAYVAEKLDRVRAQAPPTAIDYPQSFVIVGGGAAGNAAAEMLRARVTRAALPC